jgi:tRNA A-37 threonylcarbamoyl transferase component Bud32
LVSRWIPGAVPLPDAVATLREDGPALGRVLAEAGRIAGALHKRRFYHGDLPGNILLSGERDLESGWVVDLEELRRPLSRRRRGKNLEEVFRKCLARAPESRDHLGAYLEAYAAAAGSSVGEAEALYRMGCARRAAS